MNNHGGRSNIPNTGDKGDGRMPQSAALTSLLRILIESFATAVPRIPDSYQNTLPTQNFIDEVVLLPDDAKRREGSW